MSDSFDLAFDRLRDFNAYQPYPPTLREVADEVTHSFSILGGISPQSVKATHCMAVRAWVGTHDRLCRNMVEAFNANS